MKSFSNSLAKITAIILAILFVITLVFTFFLYGLEKSAFNPETYKQALSDESIYTRLPAVIGDQLVVSSGFNPCAENPVACGAEERSRILKRCLENALGKEAYLALANNERPATNAEKTRFTPCFEEYGYPETEEDDNELAPLMENLTAKDWELFLSALLPPRELKSFSDELIDQTFDFFNGNTNSASIPLYIIKERLISEEGIDAIVILLEAQPPCTIQDLLTYTTGKLPFCNPPEEGKELLKSFLENRLENISEILPDEKVFLTKASMGNEFVNAQSIRVLIRLSPLVPMVLLFLITVIMVRSIKSWLRWWGIPLLAAGGIGIFLSLLTGPILRSALNISILGRASMEISGSALQLSYDLLESIMQGLVEKILLYALISAAIGLVMTIGGAFIKDGNEKF